MLADWFDFYLEMRTFNALCQSFKYSVDILKIKCQSHQIFPMHFFHQNGKLSRTYLPVEKLIGPFLQSMCEEPQGKELL